MVFSRKLKESKTVCRRIEYELKRRVLDPYMERDDFWWRYWNYADGRPALIDVGVDKQNGR
jgi:hypothetical protein